MRAGGQGQEKQDTKMAGWRGGGEGQKTESGEEMVMVGAQRSGRGEKQYWW